MLKDQTRAVIRCFCNGPFAEPTVAVEIMRIAWRVGFKLVDIAAELEPVVFDTVAEWHERKTS